MKKIILFVIFLTLFGISIAQIPLSPALTLFNPALENPAEVGLFEGNIILNHKSQWLSMPDAPVLNSITVESPMSRDKGKCKAGLGFNYLQQNIHLLKSQSASLSYSFHIIKDTKAKKVFSLGLNFGVAKKQWDIQKIKTQHILPSEFYSDLQDDNAFISQAGFFVRWKKIGGSGYIFPLNLFDNYSNNIENFYYSIAAFNVNGYLDWGKIIIQPNVRLTFLQPKFGETLTTDIGCTGEYDDMIGCSLGFENVIPSPKNLETKRAISTVYTSLSLRLSRYIKMQYTYSFYPKSNNVKNSSINFGGTHEFALKFVFGKKASIILEEEERINKFQHTLDSLAISPKFGIFRAEEILKNMGFNCEITEDYIKIIEDKEMRYKFEFNNPSISPNKMPKKEKELKNAIDSVLNKMPNAILLIEGHTDSIGSLKNNKILAGSRTFAVKTRLGLDKYNQRIDTLSRGELQPIVLGSDSATLSPNRRVEFYVFMNEIDVNSFKQSGDGRSPSEWWSVLDIAWRKVFALDKKDAPSDEVIKSKWQNNSLVINFDTNTARHTNLIPLLKFKNLYRVIYKEPLRDWIMKDRYYLNKELFQSEVTK